MWFTVTKFSICWFTGFDVVSPLMSGMRPALLMMPPAWVVVRKSKNLKAAVLFFEYFVTEKPSPGYSTTPLIGTLLPIVVVYCLVSHVPSIIIAALPFSNCWMLAVLVNTSLLV